MDEQKPLSDDEKARIAAQYGVVVPTDLGVTVLPARKMTEYQTLTPRDMNRLARKRFLRGLKFRNAAAKQEAAKRRAEGLDITLDPDETTD